MGFPRALRFLFACFLFSKRLCLFKKPLDRVSYAKPSTGRFCYFPDLSLGKKCSAICEWRRRASPYEPTNFLKKVGLKTFTHALREPNYSVTTTSLRSALTFRTVPSSFCSTSAPETFFTFSTLRSSTLRFSALPSNLKVITPFSFTAETLSISLPLLSQTFALA